MLLRRFLSLTAFVCSFGVSAAIANPQVQFQTTQGSFVVELNPTLAPVSVKNFLSYVKEGHYSNTLFHRVINGFMVQAGGFTEGMQEKSVRAPIALESKNGLKNIKGSIAMARTGNPNSATAQFFINVADNSALDYPNPDGHGYAVFGKVIAGMEVIDKIRTTPTTTQGPHQNVPVTPIIIESAKQIAE